MQLLGCTYTQTEVVLSLLSPTTSSTKEDYAFTPDFRLAVLPLRFTLLFFALYSSSSSSCSLSSSWPSRVSSFMLAVSSGMVACDGRYTSVLPGGHSPCRM